MTTHCQDGKSAGGTLAKSHQSGKNERTSGQPMCQFFVSVVISKKELHNYINAVIFPG